MLVGVPGCNARGKMDLICAYWRNGKAGDHSKEVGLGSRRNLFMGIYKAKHHLVSLPCV